MSGQEEPGRERGEGRGARRGSAGRAGRQTDGHTDSAAAAAAAAAETVPPAMGLGRTPASLREYRRTPSFSPCRLFSPAYLRMPRSPLLQQARWEPPSLLTPHSALELLGFFKKNISVI